MRVAMTKMNNDFTSLASQERQKNVLLSNKLLVLEAQLEAAKSEIKGLNNQNVECMAVVGKWKEEVGRLRSEKEVWDLEKRALVGRRPSGSDSDIISPQVDMERVMGAVSEQVSKQMEQKMNDLMGHIEREREKAHVEQKTLGHVSILSIILRAPSN